MTTPQNCPGFEKLKQLDSCVCKCSRCGKEVEIFSDEFHKEHQCKGCGEMMNFTECKIQFSA